MAKRAKQDVTLRSHQYDGSGWGTGTTLADLQDERPAKKYRPQGDKATLPVAKNPGRIENRTPLPDRTAEYCCQGCKNPLAAREVNILLAIENQPRRFCCWPCFVAWVNDPDSALNQNLDQKPALYQVPMYPSHSKNCPICPDEQIDHQTVPSVKMIKKTKQPKSRRKTK